MTHLPTPLLWQLLALWQQQINFLADIEANHAKRRLNTAATRGEYWPSKALLIALCDAALDELEQR